MKAIVHDFLREVLFAALTVGLAVAQQAAPEKHVKDIRAEQPQKLIAATPLCKHVQLGVHAYIHQRAVDPATLEPDLYSLMQNSDEVILASNSTDEIDAVAPSGEDAVEYYDVKVLLTFKGTHKAGDLVTYVLPRGAVYCGPKPLEGSASNSSAVTHTGGSDWGKTIFRGPYILFLRQSRGEEAQLTPALRLAGGDGLQGMFALRSHYDNRYDKESYTDCLDVLPGGAAKCIAEVEASQETVKIPYGLDPLKAKYDSMPVSVFLKEVESLAEPSVSVP